MLPEKYLLLERSSKTQAQIKPRVKFKHGKRTIKKKSAHVKIGYLKSGVKNHVREKSGGISEQKG